MSLSIDLHRNRGPTAATVSQWLRLRGWTLVHLTGRPPLWRHTVVGGKGLYDITEALIRSVCHEVENGGMAPGAGDGDDD